MLRTVLTAAALAGVGWIAYRMERLMATQNEQLTALKDDLDAFFADVDAKLDQLNAQTEDFSPEAQSTFDSIKSLVAAKHAEIGDADGSDTPAEPEQPAV
ncbi:hypothetical protein Dfulv_17245 [Dactylosporangium fulvum]|uniref:Uncharacterized protein n=1 Tax=Dactylosporangium fulvum TaxID=53359 RepID=A0ABY5W9K2_9ACTN|nr:hypothetical protein [Dactylosporangium fulvum]UWP85894.1 hypothetical protein Dfulv_17245 [Dactylosporangium fulvum]